MSNFPQSVIELVTQFAKFPGIGKKTAQRLAFQVLTSSSEDAAMFAKSIMEVKTKIIFCTLCGGITEVDPCHICSDPKRNNDLLCIVEDAADIFSFERGNLFNGIYHVLGGLLSPLDGIGPEELNLDSLVSRVKPGMEIILSTNPSIEGDATALFIHRLLEDEDVVISRLARGLPVGGDLEYTDDATLIKALEGRTKF